MQGTLPTIITIPMNTTATQTCVDVCDKLLRGEISAIESYQESLEKLENPAQREELQQILEDHRRSADVLRDHISAMGAVPDSDSGAWGSFTQAVTGVASFVGQSTTISTLIQGEEHGINEYEDALEDPDVMDEIKTSIRGTLIPRLQEHITTLESLRD